MPISHDADQLKRVYLSKGQVSPILQISEFTLSPGKQIEEHRHPDATEVFYMLNGVIEFTVNQNSVSLKAGDVLVIEAGETHGLANQNESPATFFYFLLLAMNDG